MISLKQSSFDQLIDNIYQTHSILQEDAVKVINQNLSIRNWLIGCYVVEYEQNGKDRAEYGTRLIEDLSKVLKARNLKGFSPIALRNCRAFYKAYPQIQQTLSVELQHGDKVDSRIQIQSMQNTDSLVLDQRQDELVIPPALLLSKLSYSHFLELIRIQNPLERLFYEVEAINNNWSVRELERAIGSSLYVRTGLSKNKHAVIGKIKNEKPESFSDIIRNPYVLEFMDFDEKAEYSESDLEQSIITHLQDFLMELGRGFCFEARQKRITFDNTHYRIDLVFYHRILKCHVLIDLKIGAFTHADAGQMTLYLNYYEAEEMSDGDNPPIGIILCADKNDTLVKYATAKAEDQLYVSKYMLELPDKKLLEGFIKKELND